MHRIRWCPYGRRRHLHTTWDGAEPFERLDLEEQQDLSFSVVLTCRYYVVQIGKANSVASRSIPLPSWLERAPRRLDLAVLRALTEGTMTI